MSRHLPGEQIFRTSIGDERNAIADALREMSGTATALVAALLAKAMENEFSFVTDVAAEIDSFDVRVPFQAMGAAPLYDVEAVYSDQPGESMVLRIVRRGK